MAPSPWMLNWVNLESVALSQPALKGDCVRMTEDVPNPAATGDQPRTSKLLAGAYCFSSGTTELKLSIPVGTPAGTFILRNSNYKFQERFVPKDLVVMRAEKIALTAHLESVEGISSPDESLLAPASDAAMVAPTRIAHDSTMVTEKEAPPASFGVAGMEGLGRSQGGVLGSVFGSSVPKLQAAPPEEVNISAGVAVGMLIEKTTPIYPPVAKAARISRTVVLQATFQKKA